MSAPAFLTVEDVLLIHEDQILLYGGSIGLRDMALLESAVRTPMATWGGEFLNVDLFEMAASYLVSLVLNHPFEDGNKRVGTVAALLFLKENGIEIRNDEPAFSDVVIAVAMGNVGKTQVAQFFREHAEP
jgi:death-on-curing protein